MCICSYCKYHNELCYKALVCRMVIIWSCCHDVFLLRRSVIVNIEMRSVIKLHGLYVFFSGFAEVLVWFNTEHNVPQGGGLCNNAGENSM